MLIIAGLVLATFISEDAACVAAGVLVERGEVGALSAVGACAAGIFLGDLGLWAIGRFGRRVVMERPWLARYFPEAKAARVREWLEARPAAAIVTSRLIPGTRLPVYVGAGVVGMSGRSFSLWAAVAVLLWAPVPVLFTALVSRIAMAVPGAVMLPPWAPPVLAAALVLFVLAVLGRRSRGLAPPALQESTPCDAA